MDAHTELKLNEKLKEERNISNSSYAPMLVKVIVYTLMGLICISFVTLLTKIAWDALIR